MRGRRTLAFSFQLDGGVLGEAAAQENLVAVLAIGDDHESGIGGYPAEVFSKHTYFVDVTGAIEVQIEIESL